jgi:hypothetical protein
VNTPFTKSDFLDVFARYNQASSAVAFVLVVMALTAALGVVQQWQHRDRWASGVLGVLWMWSGVVFHLAFFADVNPAAIAFGVLFVVQGLGFLWRGVLRHEIVLHLQLKNARGITGSLVMIYAIVVYPLISAAIGHRWPHTPTFGAPCPVDLFTLGLLLWTKSPVPRLLLAVPLGWAVVASAAAWEFGMHEDWGLAAAAVTAVLWLWPRRSAQESPQYGHPVTAVSDRASKHAFRT